MCRGDPCSSYRPNFQCLSGIVVPCQHDPHILWEEYSQALSRRPTTLQLYQGINSGTVVRLFNLHSWRALRICVSTLLNQHPTKICLCISSSHLVWSVKMLSIVSDTNKPDKRQGSVANGHTKSGVKPLELVSHGDARPLSNNAWTALRFPSLQ